jgi:hypothetical protein
MTEPWMDMNNDISVDIMTLDYDKSTNLVLGKLPASLITKLDDRTHLFPFKIVTLGWLLLQQLYSYVADDNLQVYNKMDWTNPSVSQNFNTRGILIYSSHFKKSDNYLPIGDIIVSPANIYSGNTPLFTNTPDLNTIPVVLIKNDRKYSMSCSIIQQISYIGCNSNPPSYASYTLNDPTYQLIGLIAGNPNSFTTGVIGAVAKTHLTSVNYGAFVWDNSALLSRDVYPPTGAENCWLGSNENTLVNSCPAFCMNYTSPFFSFMGWQYPTTATVNFYDIIPTSLIMDFCNGTTPVGISNDQALFNFIKDKFTDKDICGSIDSDFCQGDNLVTDRCHSYCSSDKINCNNQYASYCSKDIVTKENNDTCACFRSTAFYSKWRQDAIDAVRKTDPLLAEAMDLLISPAINPVCDYPDCVSQNSQKPYFQGDNPPTCPSKNIQLCLQEINTDIDGGATDSKISPKTQMDCKQAVHNGDDPSSSKPPPSPSPSSKPPPSPSSNKTVIYVIGITASVIVLLLIIGLVIVILKK